jgi:hypothetical protein
MLAGNEFMKSEWEIQGVALSASPEERGSVTDFVARVNHPRRPLAATRSLLALCQANVDPSLKKGGETSTLKELEGLVNISSAWK